MTNVRNRLDLLDKKAAVEIASLHVPITLELDCAKIRTGLCKN